MEIELVGFFLLVTFVGVMLVLPFFVMAGMAVRGWMRPAAVSENRQPVSGERGTLEA